jgi:L-tartrate/succinate antiporter
MNPWWRAIAPVAVAIVIALVPAPAGLPQHAWYFFAIFSGVVVGLVLEPLPGGAVGLIGVTVVTVLAEVPTARRRPLAGFAPRTPR